MNYIITAKNIKDDPSVTDPVKRTEIATEMISTRMWALRMLKRKEISVNDCIVTRRDRFCLYENIFRNVIDYDQYVINCDNLRKTNTVECDLDGEGCIRSFSKHIDLTLKINDGHIDTAEKYLNEFSPFHPYIDQAFNISFCELAKNKKPFIALLIRNTPNHPEKNLSLHWWREFLHHLEQRNIKAFVFGENIQENFTFTFHEYVKSFKGWCSLLSNENCKAVISTCSGGVYPLFFVGNENSNLYILDNNGYVAKHKESPSFYNSCINFKNIKVNIIEEIYEPEFFINSLTTDISWKS